MCFYPLGKSSDILLMATQEEYNIYICSGEWTEKSRRFIESVGRCQECHSNVDLQCHHLNYQCLGNETKEDIQVLCDKCHEKKHEHDDYKKRLSKRFVGGQDVSINDITRHRARITRNQGEI